MLRRKPERNIAFGRPRLRLEDNIKNYVKFGIDSHGRVQGKR
jgi:hypothetical protein